MGEELDRMRRRYHLTFKHLHKNGPSLGFDCIKLKGKKAENRKKKSVARTWQRKLISSVFHFSLKIPEAAWEIKISLGK